MRKSQGEYNRREHVKFAALLHFPMRTIQSRQHAAMRQRAKASCRMQKRLQTGVPSPQIDKEFHDCSFWLVRLASNENQVLGAIACSRPVFELKGDEALAISRRTAFATPKVQCLLSFVASCNGGAPMRMIDGTRKMVTRDLHSHTAISECYGS